MPFASKEKEKAYRKLYRENNREYFLNYGKMWRKKNYIPKIRGNYKKALTLEESIEKEKRKVAYMANYRKVNKVKIQEHKKKYLKKARTLDWYKTKEKARSEVANSLRKGYLTRGCCQICGSDKKIEAHHEDYSKPLEIIWLCKKHHIEADRHLKLSQSQTFPQL